VEIDREAFNARLALVCPYLLTGLTIEQPNHVWAVDLMYLSMAHRRQYPVAVINVDRRKMLS
jgi:putative transposase